MKRLRFLIAAIAIAIAVPIGVGALRIRQARAATLTLSGSWTPQLTGIQIVRGSPNNDFFATFVFVDSNGAVMRIHSYFCKGDNTGVYDENGNQISATTPLALRNDVSSTKSDFDSIMTTAISQGKVTP